MVEIGFIDLASLRLKMYQNINHGIICSELDPIVRKSCVIFNRRYCLAPASVLVNSFEHIQHQVKASADYDIQHNLKINRIIDTNADRRSQSLKKYNFKIIHEHNEVLYESDARIVNIFKCRNIWNSFNDILRNFVARSAKNDSNDLHKLLLSSFIILRLKTTEEIQDQNNTPLAIFKEITETTNNKYENHTQVLRMKPIQKLENIESVSTPFGNECFLNTMNVGRIANIFGDNKCLMVASMPLVNGCEGGAVYNKSYDLVGIVISTTFDWNSENATLTLVAKFNEIMAEFVEQSKLTSVNIQEPERCLSSAKVNCRSLTCGKDSTTFENFIVLIQSSNSWGKNKKKIHFRSLHRISY